MADDDKFRDMMPPELIEFFREQGKKGGKKSAKARMEKLSPERRSEIARNAGKAGAAARWGGKPVVKEKTAAKKTAAKSVKRPRKTVAKPTKG